MSEAKLLRVKNICITGLFELYNHVVNLHLDSRISILHGPNGVGKTVLLRMVDATLSGNWLRFPNAPFGRLDIKFTDGSSVSVASGEHSEKAERSLKQLQVHWYDAAGVQKSEEQVPASPEIRQLLEGLPPWVAQVDQDHWLDQRMSDQIGLEELVRRYGDAPSGSRRPRKNAQGGQAVRSHANSHLIETQRLFRIGEIRESARYGVGEARTVPVVQECARDLARRVGETMARYGRESQALDQTFPQRLVAATWPAANPALLKSRMEKLENRRRALKDIGLLDEGSSYPFDLGALATLDDTQTKVMLLYVEDTEKKLGVLDDLARRIGLLLEAMNGKVAPRKRIVVDREKGLVPRDHKGQPLPLDALSSGEQHELVMHYDLLFRIEPNTLVLIDEPELSLHVDWQKRFLPDLLQVIALADFDVMLATHSPYIVGNYSDLMIALGTN